MKVFQFLSMFLFLCFCYSPPDYQEQKDLVYKPPTEVVSEKVVIAENLHEEFVSKEVEFQDDFPEVKSSISDNLLRSPSRYITEYTYDDKFNIRV